MKSDDLSVRLNEIVLRMVGREPSGNALAMAITPFDTTPQNQHDSKAAFSEEKSRVIAGIEHIDGLVDSVMINDKDTQEAKAAYSLIRSNVDRTGIQSAATRDLEKPHDLVIKNALEIGLYYHSVVLALELRRALSDRLKELKDQEKLFWSTHHRPPNHYARTIALRLARYYARETQERPTVGTSGDGGHPSTAYTKALEEVFEELGIKATVRPPAKWAVKQITDDDLKPPMLGGLFGLGGAGPFGGSALKGSKPPFGNVLGGAFEG